MRELSVKQIEDTVRQLCIDANRRLSEDIVDAVACAKQAETLPLAKDIMTDICNNITAAQELCLPVCQDTGMAVVFIELGQEVHLVDGSLTDAVNRGVSRGYLDGKLRCSVVSDPLRRINTNDNTPAVLHLSMTPGEEVRITVAPKGFGSENMSEIHMLTPACAEKQAIIDTICQTVRRAGSNPCPPMVLGVGIGGDFELCALLAKKALCRPLSQRNADPFYADIEEDALKAVNALGIGPQGFGGVTTALGVNIEVYPTHIAGLPVAVNVGCHVTRHASALL
ncbi:MAG: fumarate hydratase [Acutalibacteraceae bacterium]